MGYNTTVLILNDALGEISEDAEFGKRLAQAIMRVRPGKPECVPAIGRHGSHGNAALVVETHHADHDVLVRVGGNTAKVIPTPEASRDD